MLSPAEVAETIAAGSGFTFQNAERTEWYAERKTEVLLTGLSSWSPAVRQRSAIALSKREGDFLPQILRLLNSKDLNSRYGACEALAKLGPKADSAALQVRALLDDKDPWLRMLAARTLPCMGPEVRAAEISSLLRAAFETYQNLLHEDLDPEEFKRVDLRVFNAGKFRPTAEAADSTSIATLLSDKTEFGGSIAHVNGQSTYSQVSDEIKGQGVLFGE